MAVEMLVETASGRVCTDVQSRGPRPMGAAVAIRPGAPGSGSGRRGSFRRRMTTLACLMHWYISALYVAPVVAVGGWGWWSTRRVSQRRDEPPQGPHAA